ncbi:porin [Vibrio sp. SCSIO 43136]|uniref:porin n=1 Tax=Vibrio sp. SCSIO 43136 TaxID=2819101 RepID=UPI0020762190|nr:porin [Vibrio sp. SCSIO 43136]USD66190.1 porin [Vibrio sp. SCSIO 43136]
MKKSLLAVVIPSLMAANAAVAAEIYKSEEGSAEFYGQLRAQLHKNDGEELKYANGSSRMGVKGEYVLVEGINVFGKVEYGVKAAKDLDNRLHYMGVSGDFGKVTVGRQWVVSDETWGADYSYWFGGSGLRHATLSGARHDALIKYNYDSDAFWLAANYGMDNDGANQELAEVYAGTSFGDLSVHFGGGRNTSNGHEIGEYEAAIDPGASADITETKKATADLRNTYFEGTAEYSIGDATVGFTYYNAKLERLDKEGQIDENAFSLAGMYSLNDKATIYSGYEYVKQESGDEDGNGKNFYLGTVYKFNSWSRVFVEYQFADGQTTGFKNSNADVTVTPTVVDKASNFVVGARVYF